MELMDFKDYPKEWPLPLILPEHILKFTDDISEDETEALKNGKVVFIMGYWCVLSKRLEF